MLSSKEGSIEITDLLLKHSAQPDLRDEVSYNYIIIHVALIILIHSYLYNISHIATFFINFSTYGEYNRTVSRKY